MAPVYFPQNGSHFEWARAWACVFSRRSSHMRSRFLALPACRYLAFHVRERQITKLSTIESRVGYKMKSGEGKIWYTFAIMISRSQPRPQDFSLKKWVGREKGKAPGTRSSLFNLLDFVIYLFIYLFFEEPIVETKKVVHFNIFTSCMVVWIEWSLGDTRQGLKTLTLFNIKIVHFSTLLATLFKKGLA